GLWYDTQRWPTFVDGSHHVVGDLGGWPAEGTLVWDSVPGGRGRVMESIERYEPRVGQTVGVEDEKITGTQSIAFAARPDDRVRITLELRYELKSKPLGPVAYVLDAIFIRPRQREALARTLARFSRELAQDRSLAATP
ncbi:MAG: hypothetical protein QOG68_1928, partial [Solirubrobacteraceae bacterium]|nr:hypothetical protein [Solirubrobacteraceae bacterium]